MFPTLQLHIKRICLHGDSLRKYIPYYVVYFVARHAGVCGITLVYNILSLFTVTIVSWLKQVPPVGRGGRDVSLRWQSLSSFTANAKPS